MPNSNKILNYICFKSSRSDRTRLITVIDGQPYYQSSGASSGMQGLWFPLIMVSPNNPINPAEVPMLPKHLRAYVLKKILNATVAGYFLKLDTFSLKAIYLDMNWEAVDKILLEHFQQNNTDDFMGRVPTILPATINLMKAFKFYIPSILH